MFRNYLKISYRSIKRSPLTSFINIFGLSVAIGICLVVYAFISFDFNQDQFHANKNKVYLTTYFVDREGTQEWYGTSPAPLGKALEEDYTQIHNICRLKDQKGIIKFGQKVFHEQIRIADPEFLEMFTFPLKWGVKNSLQDVNSIIISEKMSIKYFGDDNPVGKQILVKFNSLLSKTFKVSGVAEPFPQAHIIDFDFLINIDNLNFSKPKFDINDWGNLVDATLIQVKNPLDLAAVQDGMEKYKILQNDAQPDWSISSFDFQKLADLHLNARGLKNAISYDYSMEGRVSLPIIALFMLALACFNYINIAIVSAAKRIKEIGLRKVMGANRGKVMVQFLVENIFITSFALILGYFLCITIFLPWFSDKAGWDLSLNLVNSNLWIFLIGLMVFTGIASGLYPAIYISKFQVVNILKGTVQFGKKNPLTKVFLGFQLIMACILVTGSVMYSFNTNHMANKDWGYQPKNSMYVKISDESSFQQLKSVLAQNPNVTAVAGVQNHVGVSSNYAVVNMPDRKYEVRSFNIGYDYLETMGFELTDGRFFESNHESDKETVVVNNLLAERMNLKNPIGKIVKIEDQRFAIIGVVSDFHAYSFYNEVKPALFRIVPPDSFEYLTLHVKEGSEQDVYMDLQSYWATLFPEEPFSGGHQIDVWSWFYDDLNTQVIFMRAVALIAVMLTCLGLYGLIMLNVSSRNKEFSIRKSLGAGVKNIAFAIGKPYLWLTVIALALGSPASYYLIEAQLGMMYPDPVPMDLKIVGIAILIIILVLILVISTQIRKVITANPVDGLRVD